MYDFVTHTWNTVKGQCPHSCGYCYMKKIAKRFNRPQPATYFDESELKVNLGSDKFIFVGSSNDLFAAADKFIQQTLEHCEKYNNRYLLQSKNPAKILRYIGGGDISESNKYVACTTIETNRFYREIMQNCPLPGIRANSMSALSALIKTFVTIEPILDFDLAEMVELIKQCQPEQVSIGADSGHNRLPEPPKEKVLELIAALEEFTVVNQKSNIKRILK